MLKRRFPAAIAIFSQALVISVATSSQASPATPAPANSTTYGKAAPLRVIQPEGISRAPSGLFSYRTLRVAIEVDRDQARLLRYTLQDTPYIRSLDAQGPDLDRTSPRVEVALLGPEGKRYTRGFTVPLCFEHAGNSEPHVTGDEIHLHRDTFVIELPELEGFDRLEIVTHAPAAAGAARRVRVTESLDEQRFTPAGRKVRYRDLVFAAPPGKQATGDPSPDAPPAKGVIWPEDIGDPERYRVEGVESEGTRRINVVVVPDAYLPGSKDAMISDFLAKTRYLPISPIKEHTNLINYVLVFAYSVENQPDSCDCGIIHDTAMGTRFADLPPPYDGCGGHTCLYYGSGGCDNDHHEQNIAEAELRAPVYDYTMGDTTLLIVHSERVGGCSSFTTHRTVTSSNSSMEGTWHEMGHGLASLSDEYTDRVGCGSTTREINTSLNSETGAWPEWVAELGPPIEGADHYPECVFKPTGDCLMRGGYPGAPPFCPVCTQRWPLVLYGSPRVSPTAPIESMSPASPLTTQTGVWTEFSVVTRLPYGLSITNEITWQIQGPGYPSPTTIAATYPIRIPFDLPGDYVLTAKVIADANLIKPARYGPNVDTATWNVTVSLGAPPLEVSPPGSTQPLAFTNNATLAWEGGEVSHSVTFNLYRGSVADLAQGSNGACLASSVPTNTASDAASPEIDQAWFYTVAGKTAGVIGPLGLDSDGNTRGNGSACP